MFFPTGFFIIFASVGLVDDKTEKKLLKLSADDFALVTLDLGLDDEDAVSGVKVTSPPGALWVRERPGWGGVTGGVVWLEEGRGGPSACANTASLPSVPWGVPATESTP